MKNDEKWLAKDELKRVGKHFLFVALGIAFMAFYLYLFDVVYLQLLLGGI